MDAIQRMREAMRPTVNHISKDSETASETLDTLLLAVEQCGTFNASTGSFLITANEEDE